MPRATVQKTRAGGFEPGLLGAEIGRLREAQGLTQSGLAKMAGIAKQGLSNIEAGAVVPSISTLQQIAEALHIDLLALIAFGLPDHSDTRPGELPKIEALVSMMTPKQRKLAVDLLRAVVNQGH